MYTLSIILSILNMGLTIYLIRRIKISGEETITVSIKVDSDEAEKKIKSLTKAAEELKKQL